MEVDGNVKVSGSISEASVVTPNRSVTPDYPGLDLAEMNMTLLKKVEELTLYAIEQRKENRALARRVEQLGRHRAGR